MTEPTNWPFERQGWPGLHREPHQHPAGDPRDRASLSATGPHAEPAQPAGSSEVGLNGPGRRRRTPAQPAPGSTRDPAGRASSARRTGSGAFFTPQRDPTTSATRRR